MIYVSLDTDVLLFLLSQPLENRNKFDEFIFWNTTNKLKTLVPENIKDEWKRNTEGKIRDVKNEFSKFYKATFVEDSAIKSSIEPDTFSKEAEKRVEQLYDLFKQHAILIPTTQEVLSTASNRTLKCLAPNHKKDSFRDTVNILSVIHYLRNHPDIQICYFNTFNYKDFSISKEKKHQLHQDLVNDFQDVGLNYVYSYDKLRGTILKDSLPDFSLHLKESKEEKYSPAFLNNVSSIDLILEIDRPSRAQVKFVIDLMNEDKAYYKYVFKKVSRPFWFDALREAGFLDSSEVPGPEQHTDGSYSFPSWPPLQLLEKLSKRIGEDLNEE